MARYEHNSNGLVPFTAAQESAKDAEETAWTDDLPNRQLKQIKEIRLSKLKETDYLALGDVTMSDEIKTWRQSLRDIPADYTDENAYDLLLARETDKTKANFGQLTHSIWSKP